MSIVIQRFKEQGFQSKFIRLFVHTFLEWYKDDCLQMGAALAYNALFSLFPLILVILSIFGFWVGPQSSTHDKILFFAQENLPPETYGIIVETLFQLNQSSRSAGIVGFCILMFSASNFFSMLDRDFDKIWKVQTPQRTDANLFTFAWTYASRKFFSFLLVLGVTGLILISQILNIGINLLIQLIENFSDRINFNQLDKIQFLQGMQLGFSFFLLLCIVMMLFKILPTTHVEWCDVWFGSLITSSLFIILQHLVGNSVILLGVQFQSYGAVGSVMVLMLWLYVTNQIILLGGEFTYVYSKIFGSRCNKAKLRS